MVSCNGCGTKFSIFKRKITCPPCQRYFCSGCSTKSRFNTEVCKSCKVLLSSPLCKADVKKLKVKDLQHFLKLRHIPHDSIIEKEDLINLVVVSIQGTAEQCQNVSRSNLHRPEATFVGGFSNPNYSPASEDPTLQDFEVISPESTPEEPYVERSSPSSAEEAVFSDSESSEGESTEYPCPELNRRGNAPPANLTAEDDGSGGGGKPSVKRKTSELLFEGPVSLNQMQTVDQLDHLSVRQLRDILASNRVEYKGCVEKSELLEKAKRLWKEHQSTKDVDGLAEEEICKICMNAPVNCVILECGHMLSCVDCGRQLAECPLCRQYVVRIVRTFKA